MSMFQSDPAWRKTSMGPMAVEENIWSSRRTVISFNVIPLSFWALDENRETLLA